MSFPSELEQHRAKLCARDSHPLGNDVVASIPHTRDLNAKRFSNEVLTEIVHRYNAHEDMVSILQGILEETADGHYSCADLVESVRADIRTLIDDHNLNINDPRHED